jgi:hypothetical protein|tara:strand:+ start:1341 stop:1829 length:489 start_codon:yes stop_codon:yes gene_type:complete
MAGKPKLKKALSELDQRGGVEALQRELLAGKTIPMIAKELDLDRGYFRRNVMKDEKYGNAIREIEHLVADAHADAAFEALNDIKDRRDTEVKEALNGDRDVAEGNVNQVDIGIAKGLAQQHNFIASSLNKNRYGSGSQQNIQINIGDLHLDALRKMKVIDHE